jgi:multidrug efflux pump subunit AcrB
VRPNIFAGVSADQVVQSLAAGNTIAPSGQLRVQERMPLVPTNAMVVQPAELGNIEVKPGVYLRDVVRRDPVTAKPLIEDASDIPTGYALVNGKRAVYILVTKRANASTLDVVHNVRANLPKMQAELPDDIQVAFEFDQSPYVTNAMSGTHAARALPAAFTRGDDETTPERKSCTHTA